MSREIATSQVQPVNVPVPVLVPVTEKGVLHLRAAVIPLINSN